MDKKKVIETEIMTLAEVAVYLKLSEKTVHRILRRQEIPSARVGGQWRFLKSVIDDWLFSRMQVVPRNDIAHLIRQGEWVPVSRLLQEDLIIMDLAGNDKQSILSALVRPLREKGFINSGEFFLDKLLEREQMASTAVGNGVAMPHIRRPEENIIKQPLIVTGLNREGLDFDAFDNEPTYLFFLIISDSEMVHLKVMARLSALLRDSSFVDALKLAATAGDIINLFIEQETIYRRIQSQFKPGHNP